jgi:hypothetical protein
MDVTIKPPAPDKPGYFRRFKKLAAVQQRLNSGDLAAIDDAIELILAECEVTVPDGVEPQEALMDLSREDMFAAMSAVIGGGSGVDPQNDD